MVRANEQWSLWECVGRERSITTDEENKIGPFQLSAEDLVIARHMDCVNYDSCLTFASNRRWSSFSCAGCRRTAHGRFVKPRTMRRKQ